MRSLPLDGTWLLRPAEPGEGERLGWPAGAPGGRALAAQVPGDVHLDLLAAGLIDEPLEARNAPACRWVEGLDWWYERELHVADGFAGSRAELVFEGIDTTADVWVNGELVGRSDNAHVPVVLDVTAALRPGRNLLVVRVDPGLRAATGKDAGPYASWGVYVDEPRMWIRKPQFVFGWDWATRLVTCGLWRSVELRAYDGAALRDVALRTTLWPDGAARVGIEADVELFAAGDVLLDVAVGGDAVALAASLPPGRHVLHGELVVPEPRLWWPAPLGEPTLYEARARLALDGREEDALAFRVGLREVELRREPLGEEGESFTVAVNGEPVFCKGAGWQPADSIIARAGAAKTRELVRLAAEARFNLLRVWGGGVFESDAFYDACDERGILVWQDFLYACCYYPDDDEAFLAEAAREAELGIRRLRNRASLAVWCGSNENDWQHDHFAREGKAAPRLLGERIWHELVPGLVERLDPTRPYWPSSPWGGPEPNSPLAGNRHAWEHNILNPDVEGRVEVEQYLEERPKFVSEFGCLSPSNVETLARFLPPDELHVGSPSWRFHDNDFEQGVTAVALRRFWRPPEDLPLDEYVDVAQVIQGETLAFAIEHWRRRKFRTSGAVFWGYTDCWGCSTSWSIVDYYLRRKAGYWFVRRAFAPLAASIEARESDFALWLVNDTLDAVPVELRFGLVDLATGELVEPRRIDAEAPANAAVEAARVAVPAAAAAAPERFAVWARLHCDGDLVGAARRFLGGLELGRLDLGPARVETTVEGASLVVRATGYVWQAHLERPRGVEPDDDFFDLLPGEERRIRLAGPEELVAGVTVRSLAGRFGLGRAD